MDGRFDWDDGDGLGEHEETPVREDEDAPPLICLVEPEVVTAELNGFAREQAATRVVAVCALSVGVLALGAAWGPAVWSGLARAVRLVAQP